MIREAGFFSPSVEVILRVSSSSLGLVNGFPLTMGGYSDESSYFSPTS